MIKQFFFDESIRVCHLFAFDLNVKQFYLTYRTLSGATISGQKRPGNNGNEGILHIPQTPSLLEPHYQIA